jgi:hypothetical protein
MLAINPLNLIIIIIIIGKTAYFEPNEIAFLRSFCQIASSFYFFGCRNSIFFYRTKSSALRPTPNLEDQVPIFMSPNNRLAQLYPQALGFLRVLRLAWLQRCYSNSPPHGLFKPNNITSCEQLTSWYSFPIIAYNYSASNETICFK